MSSGFVTETEAAEARKRRQEEWEKVRKADEPMERPEEPYDGRSLYDRLKEQKMKKDLDYEEEHKLKNLIRGLDDDEVQFLEEIDRNKMAAEKRTLCEVEKELQEFRKRVENLREECVDKIIQAEIKPVKSKISGKINTQKSLISIGVKRKVADLNSNEIPKEQVNKLTKQDEDLKKGHLKCVAILPGIGRYNDSSDSEVSTESDEDNQKVVCQYDLVGRKQPMKQKH